MRRKSEKITSVSVPPKKVNYVFSTLLTSLLCMSFTFMLTTTYEMEVSYLGLSFWIILFSFFATVVHIGTEDKKMVSRILLVGSLVLPVLLVYANIANTRNGMNHLLWNLQQFALRDIPFNLSREDDPETVLTRFLVLANLIPILFTTFVITRRKNPILCLPFFLPFFFCSVVLNYKFPNQIWCELALCGVVLLCFFQNLRKGNRVDSDKKLLILSIPVLLVSFLVGIWFPQKKYDKQKLAVKQMETIRNVFQNLPTNRFINDDVQNVIKEVQKSYMGSVIIDDLAASFATIAADTENLNNVGNFDPPYFIVLYVTRNVNPDMIDISGGRYLYIRTSAMDEYTGQAWNVSGDEPDEDEIYKSNYEFPRKEAPYILRVNSAKIVGHYFTPYYTDGYVVSSDIASRIQRRTDFNVRGLLGEADSQTVEYAYSELPIERDPDIWTDEYMDYVNSTALEVPDETRDAILNSGLLPDWYMEVYNGERVMSDYAKVLAVTNFVSSLHPYDKNTGFKPEDEDFVAWFMTKSPTGFCVHYASTSVILLRMLGVPARYVSGYMSSDMNDRNQIEVSSEDAHAWFEFFTPEYGWVMGDSTPGNATASSAFDINGLMKKYNIQSDSMPGNTDTGTTPQPTPGAAITTPEVTKAPNVTTPAKDKTTTPATKATVKKSFKLGKTGRVILVIVLILLAIYAVRMLYSFIWKRRFHRGSIKSRARAYYRYFSWISRKWNGRPSPQARLLAQKAVFSENGISEDELSALIQSGKQGLKNARKKQSFYKKMKVRLLYEVKV